MTPKDKEVLMGLLCVMTEDRSHLLFNEHDVKSVCRKMRCGHHADDCSALMRKRAMECVLCYAVLTALKKPYRVKRSSQVPGKKA